MSQVALNWVLQRPSVVSIVIGARDEEQLRDNLGAVGWSLTAAQMAKLDAASQAQPDLSLLAPAWLRRAEPAAGAVLQGEVAHLGQLERAVPDDLKHPEQRLACGLGVLRQMAQTLQVATPLLRIPLADAPPILLCRR